eukprot:4786421-Amphidinium_carterae.2
MPDIIWRLSNAGALVTKAVTVKERSYTWVDLSTSSRTSGRSCIHERQKNSPSSDPSCRTALLGARRS